VSGFSVSPVFSKTVAGPLLNGTGNEPIREIAMHAWSAFVKQLMRDDGGVTSIEYALIGSLIAVTILGAVASLGSSVNDLYQRIATSVAAALA